MWGRFFCVCIPSSLGCPELLSGWKVGEGERKGLWKILLDSHQNHLGLISSGWRAILRWCSLTGWVVEADHLSCGAFLGSSEIIVCNAFPSGWLFLYLPSAREIKWSNACLGRGEHSRWSSWEAGRCLHQASLPAGGSKDTHVPCPALPTWWPAASVQSSSLRSLSPAASGQQPRVLTVIFLGHQFSGFLKFLAHEKLFKWSPCRFLHCAPSDYHHPKIILF